MILHIAEPAEWAAAVASTEQLYTAPSLIREGFIHCSTSAQLLGSAERHFPDDDELVVIVIDAERAGAPLVFEDSYGSGTEFPHLYGPVPVAAVSTVAPLRRVGGRFVWPEELPAE